MPVIVSSSVASLHDKPKGQEVTSNFRGDLSSAGGGKDPGLTTLGGSGDVTVRTEDGNSAVNFNGTVRLGISGNKTIQQTIQGGGRFDHVLYRFDPDLYLGAAAIITGCNNKQQGILGRMDYGGGLDLSARFRFGEEKKDSVNLNVSSFLLGEKYAFYGLSSKDTFIVSGRLLFEARVKKFRFGADSLAYLDALNVGASRFSFAASAGYAASDNIEIGVSYGVDVNLSTPIDPDLEVYRIGNFYVKVGIK